MFKKGILEQGKGVVESVTAISAGMFTCPIKATIPTYSKLLEVHYHSDMLRYGMKERLNWEQIA